MIKIDRDVWVERFKPKLAPSGNYGMDFGNGSTLLEINDYEHGIMIANAFINEPENLWTVILKDDDEVVVPGFKHVNAKGHIITEKPCTNPKMVVLI